MKTILSDMWFISCFFQRRWTRLVSCVLSWVCDNWPSYTNGEIVLMWRSEECSPMISLLLFPHFLWPLFVLTHQASDIFKTILIENWLLWGALHLSTVWLFQVSQTIATKIINYFECADEYQFSLSEKDELDKATITTIRNKESSMQG